MSFKIKPPLGAPLNYYHPLANGLIGCWLFNEQSGQNTFSTVPYPGGVTAYGPNGGLSDSGVVLENGVIKFDASEGGYQNNIYLFDRIYLTAGSPFTLIWSEKVIADTDTYPGRFSLVMAGTANDFLVAREKGGASYGGLLWGRAPNTIAGTVGPVTAINPGDNVGEWVTFAITGSDPNSVAAADYSLYMNGISKPVENKTNLGTPAGKNRIGYMNYINGPNCYMNHVLIYNKILTPSEIKGLYSEPYAMFEPAIPNGVLFGYVAAAVAPTSVLYGPLCGPLAGPI